MSNGDVLAQLRDIHMPDPIQWWPLAPAWYGLAGLIILGIVAICFARYFYRQRMAKQEALRLLLVYEKQAQLGDDSSVICAQITTLLRRVALVYFPRQDIAGLQGDAWLKFLNQTGKKLDFMTVKSLLLERPYQSLTVPPVGVGEELKPLFLLAQAWIKQRRRRV